MKNKSIKKNLILSTLYQILTLIIPFITAPYISRVIGAEGVGIYSYTLSIGTYFTLFAALGTVSYGTREIARNRDDKQKRSKSFWEIETLTIITSFICILLWFIFIGFSKDYKIYYLILTLNLLNTMMDISWFYAGLEEFKYTILQNSIFKILGCVSLFIFIKKPTDLALYIFIMCISTLLGTVSMWIYLPKFIGKVNIKDMKIKHHFKETFVYFIPTIATSIYNVLDKTLIGVITQDAYENGYYEQASKIVNMTKALTFTSLNTVLGARISYLFKENKIEEIKSRINKSINYIFFMGFGIMFGLIGVSKLFVPLFFGDGYEKVILLTQLMSPLVIIIGLSNCLGTQYYNPAGLRSKSAKFIIIGSISNLILNILFIPKLSSYGAVISTIVAESLISILYLIYCNGFLTIKSVVKSSYKKIISGCIMLLIVYLIGLLNINVVLKLGIQVVSGIIIYILVLLILRDEFTLNTSKYLVKKLVRRT